MKKRKKTALVFSGGGSRGAYQAGAWQALTELGISVDIVTGTSVGAINGAVVVQNDLELAVKLWREIETHMIFDVPEGFKMQDYAKEFVKNKGASTSGLKKLLEEYIDEEKVFHSPIDYGLVVVKKSSMEPRYVFKEDMKKGQLIDYILASASIYPALKSHVIEGVEYIDGGYADVLPVKMAAEKGADEIIAVYLDALGFVNRKNLQDVKNLTWIESKWNLGSTLIFDTANARRIMRLGYLDTMKAYHVFDGEYYTFAKNTFDVKTTLQADHAAYFFKLDPCLIYTKASFLEKLQAEIYDCAEELEELRTRFHHVTVASMADLKALLKIAGEDVIDVAQRRSLAIFVAEHIRDHGKDSFFLSHAAEKLLPELVAAGKFLVTYDLV